jgi:hypothetical protein
MNCLTDSRNAADSAPELEEAVAGLRQALDRWLRSLQTIHAERNVLRHRLRLILYTMGQPGLCASCQAEIFWLFSQVGVSVPYGPDGQPHFHEGGVS